MADYVEARLLYDSGRLSEALPYFQKAVDGLKEAPGVHLRDLHYYTGDSYNRLQQYADAEREFVEEIAAFPLGSRAYAALATLYRKTGRLEAAAETIDALLRLSPTVETYRLAARLWTTFGDPRRAAAVHAEAQRRFAPPLDRLPAGQ